jgi:hypothetical protein
VKIEYHTPYTPSRNLAEYYRFAIQNAKAEWVCFTDGDALFPCHDFGSKLEAILSKASDKYKLLTCKTNRTGQPIQLERDMFDILDMKQHYLKFDKLWKKYGTSVKDVTETRFISGHLMLMNVEFFKGFIGGQGLLGIDNQIHQYCITNGVKVGLMEGFYIYHYYRNGDFRNNKHLL